MKNITTLSLCVLMGGAAASAGTFTPDQEKEIKSLVEKTIKENPKMLMSSLKAAAEQEEKEKEAQAVKNLASSKDTLFKNMKVPHLGNPNGSKVIAVFLDPYCGHCRDFHDSLEAAVKENKDAKVVVRDLPIFGEPSMLAVSALLAANMQGKYFEFTRTLFSTEGPQSKDQLMKLAGKVGIDVKKLEADMGSSEVQKIIQENMTLAQGLNIQGTPGVASTTKIIPGKMDVPGLKQLIEDSI